jgi:type I restriction enzyme R subunit
METTDMAVVISKSQNEIADFKDKGLDIEPHRRRMVKDRHSRNQKFKALRRPLCASSSSVPCGSPALTCLPFPPSTSTSRMRNHTLMQTIARANRVFETASSTASLLTTSASSATSKRALAIYGSAQAGAAAPGENPVQSKQTLVAALREAVTGLTGFLTARGISPNAIFAAPPFQQIQLLDAAVDALLVNEDTKKRYLALAANVANLYQAILPDPSANEFESLRALFAVLAKKILNTQAPADISSVLADVEELLDTSIAAEGYVIHAPSGPDSTRNLLDLNRIDFDALKAQFDTGLKNTQAERLKGAVNTQLKQLVRLNHTRMNFQQEFEQMIEEYNSAAGGDINTLFNNLIDLTQRLRAEAQRHQAESLTEEELALYDLLVEPSLTPLERDQVKQITRDLLQHLKTDQLVLDWRKRGQSKAAVQAAVLDYLDRLPESYSTDLYNHKADLVYQHIYDSYSGQGRSVYDTLAG